MKRNIYLKMKSLSEARELFLTGFDWIAAVGAERIATAEALGRVTAEPVFAAYSSPSYHSAAMDGVAVRACDTFQAREEAPLSLTLGEGAFLINTGAPLPPSTDAVVMIEHTEALDEDSVEIARPVAPGQNVTETIRPLALLDVGVRFKNLWRDLTAAVYVYNVFDHRYYEPDYFSDPRVLSRPQPKPGFSVYGQVSIGL